MLTWYEVEFRHGFCWKEVAGFTVNDGLGGFTQFDIEVFQGIWHCYDGSTKEGAWMLSVQIDEHPWAADEGPFESRQKAKEMVVQLLREYAQNILREIE